MTPKTHFTVRSGDEGLRRVVAVPVQKHDPTPERMARLALGHRTIPNLDTVVVRVEKVIHNDRKVGL